MKTASENKTEGMNLSDPLLDMDESKIQREVIRVDPTVDCNSMGNSKYTNTIGQAITIAKPGSIIQIAAGVYSESLVVTKPGLIIESLEEDGKVVILSGKKPCLTVRIDNHEKIEINRIRMLCKGPNSETKFTQKIDMNYEKIGNEKCFLEFKMATSMPCVFMLKSGILTLNRCVLSLNGIASHMNQKIPCLAIQEEASVYINNWFFYGDSTKEVFTAGIFALDPHNLIIKDTVIKDHTGGGIMVNLVQQQDSKYQFINNKIIQWETAGIYIAGEGSTPFIEGNEIKNCKAVGIKISDHVLAEIRENILHDNNDGIELLNNKSKILANEIEKSHGHGILIISEHKDGKLNSLVKGNTISNCKFNGIQIQGEGLRPSIRNNTIKHNRKCGIKVMDKARADIIGRNYIHTNYNQGICIVEGSSCKITENTISKNVKANIAYGGKGSNGTTIERNEISESMAEGIFLVKGDPTTLINENIIRDNLDGISLSDSNGKIAQNLIEGNQRCGIQCSGYTKADISYNQIKSNILIGILIKEPSDPKVGFNILKDNHYQFSVDKHVRKKGKTYTASNTVKGQNDIPKVTWTIF